jgi:hypothetical protein
MSWSHVGLTLSHPRVVPVSPPLGSIDPRVRPLEHETASTKGCTEPQVNRPRTRRSARQAGTRFETLIATALAAKLDDDRIERRTRNGAKDRGDISGLRLHGQRVVLECKDTCRLALPEWTAEAQIEAGNDDALVGLVVHKRHGDGDPMRQWVSMTVADLVAILSGQRAEL